MDSIKGRIAEAALDKPYLLVKQGTAADEVTPTTASTDAVLGVVPNEAAAGKTVKVIPGGYVKLMADGAISNNDELIPGDTAGKTGYAMSTTGGATGDAIIGKALQTVADGDDFWAILFLDKTGRTKA